MKPFKSMLAAMLSFILLTGYQTPGDGINDLCNQYNDLGQVMINPDVKLLGATCSAPFFTLSLRLVNYESHPESDIEFETSMEMMFDSTVNVTSEFDVLRENKYILGFMYQDMHEAPVAYIFFYTNENGQFELDPKMGDFMKKFRQEYNQSGGN